MIMIVKIKRLLIVHNLFSNIVTIAGMHKRTGAVAVDQKYKCYLTCNQEKLLVDLA